MAELVRFSILGAPVITVGDRAIALGAPRDLTVLAMLLLRPGETVPNTDLIDAVWVRPPKRARTQIQGCIFRLRRLLAEAGGAPDAIETYPNAYRAALSVGQLDLLEFRQLLARARTANHEGKHAGARANFRAALALWRAPACIGIESELVQRYAHAVDEERLQAQQECLDVERELGLGPELVPELTRLVHEHPYQEGFHVALMHALHRAGRPSDALEVYRRVQRLLREELATEPGDALQQLHQRILAGDSTLAASRSDAEHPEAGHSVPQELPADVADFTGRADELRTLDQQLSRARRGSAIVLCVIAGTAGVGKTALAVNWAHRVADRTPDGQLYLNLRGAAPQQPLRIIEALTAMLRSLGVPPAQIPTDADQAAALYRGRLAGRRVLVVLDDAASVEQVRPLLPGTPGCLVIVTSRDRLSGLVSRNGATRVTLDVLPASDAVGLLTLLLGADRIADEREATEELARRCAYLPLALRVAASNLINHPHQSIAGYLRRLAHEAAMEELRNDDDAEAAIQTAFDLSYSRLPGDAQRMFGLLGLVPGPDFTPEAAAALAQTDLRDARSLLDRLARSHLVTERARDRYTFHDLLQAYARTKGEAALAPGERAAAVDRLITWYLANAHAAATMLSPETLQLPLDSPVSQPASPTGDAAQARTWLDAEAPNLIAAIHLAATDGTPEAAWRLAFCLRRYFWSGGYSVEWQAAAETALAAAVGSRDTLGQAAARLNLGDVYFRLSRADDSLEQYLLAASLARECGWTGGEGACLGSIGIRYILTGELERAEAVLTRRLDLTVTDKRPGVLAATLGNLANVYREQGRLLDALVNHEQARALYADLGAQRELAGALSNIADLEHLLGRSDDALAHLQQGITLARETGHGNAEFHAFMILTGVHADNGRTAAALEAGDTMMALARSIHHPMYTIMAANMMGTAYAIVGRAGDAIDSHTAALELSRHAAHVGYQARALAGLAQAYLMRGDTDGAGAAGQEAVTGARRSGFRLVEGHALTTLAAVALDQGHQVAAQRYAERALTGYRAMQYRLGEARVRAVLAPVMAAIGDTAAARRHWRTALDIYSDTGAEPPDEVAQWLAESQSRPTPTDTSSGTDSS